MFRKFFLFYVFVPAGALVVLSCNLNNFAPATPLHPPLGLTLVSSNSTIFASFWAFNDEEFFSGYNVYMGSTHASASNRTDVLPNSSGGVPSFPFGKSSELQRRICIITTDPSGAVLTPGATWYLTVSAWDYRYSTNSALGEILPVQVQ